MNSRDDRLVECMRLLEETGNLERCLELYPELEEELAELQEYTESLRVLTPSQPDSVARASSRRLLLSSLTPTPGGMGMLGRLVSSRLAATFAALALLAFGALGASAAAGGPSGPVGDLFETLGVGGEHGDSVRQIAHDTPPGPGHGQAVCEAAHDRSTLPTPAQNAPGQEGREPKDCANDGDGDGGEPAASETPDNHGQNVRDAVHNAQATATPGPGRGRDVSEAACEAAHDRTTLPTPAQNAPGQEGREPKDCTDD